MPAIVLTCDEYRPFTENMVQAYEELWPSHPFVFHIPFQKNANPLTRVPGAKIKMVSSPRPIRGTILALLEPFHDDVFIYWCIDDRFPLAVAAQKLDSIFASFLEGRVESSKVDGLAFTRARGLLGPPNLDSKSELLLDWRVLRRRNLNGIWFPQVLRVGFLRDFYSSIPELVVAKQYDHWKKVSVVPKNLFVTRETLISHAESTHRGIATALALETMSRRGISPRSEFFSAKPPKFRRIGHVGGMLSRLSVFVGFSLRRINQYLRSRGQGQPSGRKPSASIRTGKFVIKTTQRLQ